MKPKEKYKKAGFKIEVVEYIMQDLYFIRIADCRLDALDDFKTEAEAWQWVEDNFPLPDEFGLLKAKNCPGMPPVKEAKKELNIEAIKKKWQKERTDLMLIRSNGIDISYDYDLELKACIKVLSRCLSDLEGGK